ncbi:hypothetical protein SDC9_156947 [bioreactor metagenome]|uniref:Uncharacterized protein n=1 Tax=bioreactor metagenome TaxID=1076179 RepID=A0A645F7M9_9ZZZZ
MLSFRLGCAEQLGPAVGEQLTSVGEELRQGLGAPDDRQKVRIALPARNDVLMQVRGDTRPGDLPLVHAQIESGRSRDVQDHPDGLLGELGHLHGFLRVEIDIGRDVPVGAHQQVARVVRVEIADHIRGASAMHDQRLLVRTLGRPAEGALACGAIGRLGAALDVDHPVGRPQPLQRVGLAG